VEALSNRATALLELNRIDEALAGLERAHGDSNHHQLNTAAMRF
jgi:hypothetical protein